MQILEKPMAGLNRIQTANLIAFFTDQTCGESCWRAKDVICRCECGGKNHGINLRGENAIRACRIQGRRYELVSVGKHGDLMETGARLTAENWLETGKTREAYGSRPSAPYTRDDLFWNDNGVERVAGWIGIHHLKGAGSLYAVKYASLPQCLKWKELEYFDCADDRDRYQKSPAILWKLSETAK